MCGIYGFISNDKNINESNEELIFEYLWKQSENRGKEACGVALLHENQQIIKKYIQKSSVAYKDKNFKNTINNFHNLKGQKILVGHSRLQTNGERNDSKNNQPIEDDGQILLHNGIICNFNDLYKKNNITKTSDLDSEYLLKRYKFLLKTSDNKKAMKDLFSDIEGEATIVTFNSRSLDFASNCGNLYYIFFDETFEIVFSSESIFLEEVKKYFPDGEIKKLNSGSSIFFDLQNKNYEVSEVSQSVVNIKPVLPLLKEINLNNKSFWNDRGLQICNLGILNENMPGIRFDEEGVSNFSKSFEPFQLKNINDLHNKLDEHRSSNRKHDILVGFSGGRDSSFMLHLLKEKYNMNPVAVTYDWGMVTDLARRNQARICGKLGIEHIIVAADIPLNRKYINEYVNAWLDKPHLGMVPLFMAGDKKYFQILNDTALKYDINLIAYGASPYEFTSFKTGFAGVVNSFGTEHNLENILDIKNFKPKINLSLFYLKQVLSNNKYWNKSIIDALFGFKNSYFEQKDFLQMYDYEVWDEDNINNILINEYGWETDPTIPSSWRIGDGSAPFYNFIYKSFVDFSEHDTFRNNQVLSNIIDRKTALNIVKAENEPRFEKIEEYLDLINIDYDSTIDRILSFSQV